jgi:hypothetical protein
MAKRKHKRSKRKPTRTNRNNAPVNAPVKPPVKTKNENPFTLIMYHFVRIPWYIVKTFDWLFTLFTALLVYLTK